MTKLNQLPKLSNSEFHYLIDTEEYYSHDIKHKDWIVVYEYTSNLLEISNELIINNIPFSHHISEDIELSYLIIEVIDIEM